MAVGASRSPSPPGHVPLFLPAGATVYPRPRLRTCSTTGRDLAAASDTVAAAKHVDSDGG